MSIPPDSPNPFTIIAYVVGSAISLPLLVYLVKGIVYLAKSTSTLERVDVGLDTLNAKVEKLQKEKDGDDRGFELSLTIIESDVNELQRKNGLPVRAYPDRRVGPADRRQS